MLRTFLDSGVLIAAARALDPDGERALRFLGDPNRLFLTSPFVHLEVIPKAIFFKKGLERSFYDRYFTNAEWYAEVGKVEVFAVPRLRGNRHVRANAGGGGLLGDHARAHLDV